MWDYQHLWCELCQGLYGAMVGTYPDCPAHPEGET